MKNDVVFRSEVLKAIEDELWLSDSAKAAFRNILVHVPAVDAETVFKQVGLVKEAFDMAKADLMPVVRCEDCNAWKTNTAMDFLRDGVHVRCCLCSIYDRLMYDDDFCSKGKRRADECTKKL